MNMDVQPLMRVLAMAWLGWSVPGMISCKRERILGPPKAVPVAEDGVLRLRAMTFNVRNENPADIGPRAWGKRVHGVVRMIREERVDVIGVQEALHGQVADLWASLPDYEFVGCGRDDGGRGGEYAGIFYRRDRFEMDASDQGEFWLSDTPMRPGSMTWGNSYPRMVVWARFADRASDVSFTCYNTHWDHRHEGSRRKSAGLMRKHLGDRVDGPLLVLGDFNTMPESPALQSLVGTKGEAVLKHTYQPAQAAGGGRTTLHFWSGRRVGELQVDHILVSPRARVIDAEIRDHDVPLVSDHFPVIAEMEFRKD